MERPLRYGYGRAYGKWHRGKHFDDEYGKEFDYRDGKHFDDDDGDFHHRGYRPY